MRRRLMLLLVLAGVVGPGGISGLARLPGQLDPSFGVGGLVTTPFPNGAVAEGVAVQPDGRIVVVGWTLESDDGFEDHADFAVARYLPNGNLDSTFGSGGLVTTDWSGRDDRAFAVAVRPDGSILVGGTSSDLPGPALPFGKGYFALAQYTSTGALDPGFGTGGGVIADPGGLSMTGPSFSMALQPDGRVVAGAGVGFAVTVVCPITTPTYLSYDFGLIRVDAGGTLDPTFNSGGPVITDFHGGSDEISAVIVGADGRITVAGRIGGTPDPCNGIEPGVVGLARYQASGALDATFGNGGVVETAFDGRAHALALQTDGKVVVGAGVDSGQMAGALLARFDAAGGLDPGFGVGGLVSDARFSGSVSAVTVQPDGMVIAVGEARDADDEDQFGVGRYRTDGSSDAGFGVAGHVVTVFEQFENSEPEAVALQSDGKIVVAGVGSAGFALARYLAGDGGNVVLNGTFDQGLSGWLQFATPDPTYLVAAVVDGVLEFHRLPPAPGSTNQAVVFQPTGIAFNAGAPLEAAFQIGNSSTVRKRISVLIHDLDFSDLSVCTFWLEPQAPLATYGMRTHTTQAWSNATISFYAATTGSDGGAYRLDNVSLAFVPNGPTSQTECIDPTAPAPPGGADGPTLVANGDFGTGIPAPWATFGTITYQVAGGVFEFVRPTSTPPAGVVFQPTSQSLTADQILSASFALGNSSAVRKRVTVVMHDIDFADLAACTFWLDPGQPLSTYNMRTFATQAWVNATISFYGATIDPDPWIRLDNVVFQRTPATLIGGTVCEEPGSAAARR